MNIDKDKRTDFGRESSNFVKSWNCKNFDVLESRGQAFWKCGLVFSLASIFTIRWRSTKRRKKSLVGSIQILDRGRDFGKQNSISRLKRWTHLSSQTIFLSFWSVLLKNLGTRASCCGFAISFWARFASCTRDLSNFGAKFWFSQHALIHETASSVWTDKHKRHTSGH